MAQPSDTNPFADAWKSVDSLEQKGLLRPAREAVRQIYTQAKTADQVFDQTKALLYHLKYNSQLEGSSDSLNISLLQQEIQVTSFPMNQVLASVLASSYFQYYSSNRYKLLNRTQLAAPTETDDFETWNLFRFHKRISQLYLESLNQGAQLQGIPIRDFEPLLITRKESPLYRPTLYDLLAHRAFDYFNNTEATLVQPGDKFELLADQYLKDADSFVEMDIPTPDTLSKEWMTLKLYQDVLRYQMANKLIVPMLDTELKRLQYLKNRATGEQKDSLYIRELEKLAEAYPDQALIAEAHFHRASYYQQQGNLYNAHEGEAHKWDKKKAVEICESTIKEFEGSLGANQCVNLRENITRPYLNCQLGQNVSAGKPFLAQLEYQNIDRVYFRLVPLNKELEAINNREKFRAAVLQSNIVQKSWSQAIKNEGDFQRHSTEIALEGLAPGSYALLSSPGKDFNPKENLIEFVKFRATTISYFYLTDKQGNQEIHVRERFKGKPLKGVSIQPFKYTYRDRKLTKMGAPVVTNEFGYALLKSEPEVDNLELEFTYKKEIFKTGRIYAYGFGRSYTPPRNPNRTFFFTDRRIYRPGQTIYFKALVLSGAEKTYKIFPQHQLEITLYDANNQKVKAVKLITNEYGTVSGSFVAPTSGLSGNMQIRSSNGSTDFSVEEYKRPRFEVSFESVEGNYQLGEEISVTGVAKAYAGSNIDGATVTYRVEREVQYPYWFWWRRPRPYTPAREITFGTTTTNAEGKFTIDFTALPDEAIPQKDKPIFTYAVHADVVDMSGETHSSTTRIRAAYTQLDLSMSLPDKLPVNGSEKCSIRSNNLNGSPVSANAVLTISKLEAPKHAFRSRKWTSPDQPVLSQAEFKAMFPYEVYADEDRMTSWPATEFKKVELTLEGAKEFSISAWMEGADPGAYKFELVANDPSGEELRIAQYTTLHNPSAKRLTVPKLLDIRFDKTSAEPGETVKMSIRTAEKKIWVLYEREHQGSVVDRRYLKVKAKRPQYIDLPIEEKHRGNVSVSVTLVRYNTIQQLNQTISVPWSNKDLKLSWSTFRSKLLPGQEEEWKLTISGPKGEKVAAEMLAAMYDASLDAFRSNVYGLSIYPFYYQQYDWQSGSNFAVNRSYQLSDRIRNGYRPTNSRTYDALNLFGFGIGRFKGYGGRPGRLMARTQSAPMPSAEPLADAAYFADDGVVAERAEGDLELKTMNEDLAERDREEAPSTSPQEGGAQIRTNLQETAFFFPHLQTNEEGEIILNFTIPEALTRWKFIGLAHTKELEIGTLTGSTVTQKDLMVFPNVPRFFREGDQMQFSAKVTNLSEQALNGNAQLRILDAFSMEEIPAKFDLTQPDQAFQVDAGLSTALNWDIRIPEEVQAVVIQVFARAGDFSDGEEHIVPILKNRMLVTESIPLAIRGKESKKYVFKKLVESDTSTTLTHQKLTLEFTSNPAWYAVQSLPYLMEYPHQCTEQIFSRFYANALAGHIANSSPRVRQIFDQWKNTAANQDGQSLLSQLEKNQELKSVLLEETPWVLNAQNEQERKKRIGLLFDINRMGDELSRARRQLMDRQNDNGAFSWFPGMQDSRYITQLITTGIGHLQHMNVDVAQGNPEVSQMIPNALRYLDGQITADYERLKRFNRDLKKDHLGTAQMQYLYMRSFFVDQPIAEQSQEAYNYYFQQGKKYWLKKSHYMQGMLALIYHRSQDQKTAGEIIAALRESAVLSDELGMYWKDLGRGWFWFQAPIERQALLIEAFHEAGKDQKSVEEMKIWLLRNKQTHDWKTTRATVAAVNALLSTGQDWLQNNEIVAITLGNLAVNPFERPDAKVEAGTGYFKTAWTQADIQADMGRISLSKNDDGIAWGSLYWQYFEQLDKITYAETPLKLQKQLFLQENTDRGPQLKALSTQTQLKKGDRVKVRIELRVDRDMEYVHMKDMRAAAFEPINVLSSHKYQAGLSYYESTKDAATHFFFEYLPKGTHVFEYTMIATQSGNFSNGIASIQCMYAPEFTSHSEGIRVQVK